MIVENIFFDRSDRINFCAEIMHRNFPPPNLCDLRPQWGLDLGAARGKLTFPKFINDPVCHGASISKRLFPEKFLEN